MPKATKTKKKLPKTTKYHLFKDGPRRWVLTEDYQEEHAPVFLSIQDAYEWCEECTDIGPFHLIVHGDVGP